VACAPGFYATRFFAWIEELRPTWYTAVPTMHQAIVARAQAHRETIARHPLRFIRSSSSALAPTLMAELEAAFQAPVIESYGMTEASHQMASNPLPPAKRKPGSVGMAAGPEIAILDEAGNLLPEGKRGEVAIRGENVTRGYENNPAANQGAFSNGWFRTGDQGYLDSEGYLFLTGRLKELINRGGEKISPWEVDEVLLEHPGIAQAITFAIPHLQLGEDVGAAVVLRENASLTEMQVREFVAGRLAAFKAPRVVRIVEEIPKGATGKVQRIGLAQKLGIEPLDERGAETSAPTAAPRTALEGRLIEIWREVLEIEQIGIQDNFFALGGDSVLATQLIARAGETLAASVPFLRFLERPTIAGMAESIEQAAGDRKLAGLTPIQTHGSKPPIFCAGGHIGNLTGFCKLARHLDPERPIFAFPPPRLEAGQACYRLEDLAARYVELMRAVEPQGPYYLAGHCFGGLVVYEMACQLQRQGLKVAWLALLDCFNPRAAGTVPISNLLGRKLRNFVRRSRLVVENLAQRKPREALSYLRERTRTFLRNTGYGVAQIAYDLLVGSGRPLPGFLRQTRYANRYAQKRYVPRPYPGPVVLFRVRDLRPDARLLGWEGLIAGAVEIYEGPYHPRGLTAEPVAVVAAQAFEASLEKARTQ
jgi:thioesterase domain-containing protein/acyl carrier protein